jgi:hypothetical protein
MKEKIKKYVDSLFSGIYDTKQLRELKEEVSANLMEKINDYIAGGSSEASAFSKAASELGDMSELIDSLKKVSINKTEGNMVNDLGLDRKHIIGYLVASTILLFGLMTSGIMYLQEKNLFNTIAVLMPFFIGATALYVYFGLTQESPQDYGMNSKRAMAYSLATTIILLGAFASGYLYFSGNELFIVLATLMPFLLISGVIYIYLGLTEKSRRKMDSAWQKQWVENYSNPETMMVRGNLSGALWIFSIAAFFFIGFNQGWKYSWIVFVVAVCCELLIEAYFASRGKKR